MNKRSTAEEEIVSHHQKHSMSKSGIKRIEAMEFYMDEYDKTENSKNANGELLNCGERRKCKDLNGVARVGRIYHNINNMWWVIVGKYDYYNVPSYNIMGVDNE